MGILDLYALNQGMPKPYPEGFIFNADSSIHDVNAREWSVQVARLSLGPLFAFQHLMQKRSHRSRIHGFAGLWGFLPNVSEKNCRLTTV